MKKYNFYNSTAKIGSAEINYIDITFIFGEKRSKLKEEFFSKFKEMYKSGKVFRSYVLSPNCLSFSINFSDDNNFQLHLVNDLEGSLTFFRNHLSKNCYQKILYDLYIETVNKKNGLIDLHPTFESAVEAKEFSFCLQVMDTLANVTYNQLGNKEKLLLMANDIC